MFFIFAALSLIWAVVFNAFARDVPVTAKPKTLAENLAILGRCLVVNYFVFIKPAGPMRVATAS